MSDPLFFNSWTSLGRTLVIGILAYAALVVLLRTSGKRTLSKLNAFDFVVTVALGSTLATILLNKDVTLAQGALAFAILAGLQYVVAWLSVRFAWARRLFKSEPRLLLYRGQFLAAALRDERVTQEEIQSVVRSEGYSDLASIEAVILETDGTFSVIPKNQATGQSALESLEIPQQ